MSKLANNLSHCAVCPNLLRQNPPRCGVHVRQELIDVLVRSGACPQGRHGQPLPIAPPARARRRTARPGDLVALIIASLGFAASASCACDSMRERMNRLGWVGCWRERNELVAWFAAQAKDAGIEVPSETIFGLFRTALFERYRGRINRASKPG